MPNLVDSWLNYPGLELWKFLNLLIFVILAFYLHRRFGRPIREALQSRGEGIRHQLEAARRENERALTKLAEVEGRFANLDAEVAATREKARREADAEKERIAKATEVEIARIRVQAKREIEIADKAVRQNLRRFAAQESVRLAEVIIAKEMSIEDDQRLMKMKVQRLGGARG